MQPLPQTSTQAGKHNYGTTTGQHSTVTLSDSLPFTDGRLACPSVDDFQPHLQHETDGVLRIYQDLEKLPHGVRGDGYADGQELTREGRGTSWSQRWRDIASSPEIADQVREDAVLAKTDRYGFFSPQKQQRAGHHYSTCLSTSAYEKRAIASSGNAHDGNAAAPIHQESRPRSKLIARTRRREENRISKWGRMLSNSNRGLKTDVVTWKFTDSVLEWSAKGALVDVKAHRRVYKGIPDRWRPAAWQAMLDIPAISSTPAAGSGGDCASPPRSPARSETSFRSRLFERQRRTRTQRTPTAPSIPQSLSQQHQPASLDQILARRTEDWSVTIARFTELQEQPSEQDVQIDLDVPRTISGHVLFHTRYGKGQRALFRVLHAFSLLCPDCGYCQGMAAIACTLLIYFEPARAYACLVRIHDGARYGLHDIFLPGFPGLGILFGLHARLIAVLMPSVATALEHHCINPSMYCTKWYITLFYNMVPFETQLRIWDAFLLDGRDVLVYTAVALVWGVRRRILDQSDDFESILKTLTSFFLPEDDDVVMRWIRRLGKRKTIRRRMASWANDPTISQL